MGHDPGEPSNLCSLCGLPGAVMLDPPRRTLARSAGSDNPSLSVIALLPETALCNAHADAVDRGALSLGWCDNEPCRVYGEAGVVSPCGDPFKPLKW
jgi:hypothetical protein